MMKFFLSLLLFLNSLFIYSDQHKIVGLLQVKNEEIFIEQCLRSLACYTDAIIVLNDGSTDNTLAILTALQDELKIEKIINFSESSWLKKDEAYNRQSLLQAGRAIGGTHFILIDADEMFSAVCLQNNWLRSKILSMNKGEVLAFPMINVWDSIYNYRDDSSCNPQQTSWQLKSIFCDDGQCNYSNNSHGKESHTIHVGRLPQNLHDKKIIAIDDINLCMIHFKYANINNCQIKHIWYMCLEFIRAQENFPERTLENANKINNQYKPDSSLLFKNPTSLKPVLKEWYKGYTFFKKPDLSRLYFNKKQEILSWIEQYGKEFFKHLNIWNTPWL